MSAQIKDDHNQPLAALALGAMGVVFGDIGTSPLYALKEVFHSGVTLDKLHIYGALSLVFWALMLVVALKYAIFIMRADNKGEGGIMALLALALHINQDRDLKKRFIITVGLVGAVLFYGDSVITPAISVLSAVEGLQIVAPKLQEYVIPVTLMVLGALFLIQSRGTHAVGKVFGPIMCLWFGSLAVMGVWNIAQNPSVLSAINPYYGVMLLHELGWKAMLVMGTVVLAITGAEALYADMGHFGAKPIRYAWFGFVLPALVMNYFGQGALLMVKPEALENPFYLLAPDWALTPLLVLATLATVIASQSVISGAFSVTRQAIQLGFSPRMVIRHTSEDEMGQIYVPTINWLLMVAVFILVLSFESSSALASAYGLAVTGTMIADTILAFIVISEMWHWNKVYSFSFVLFFSAVDLTFFASNTLKIPEGGWLPLAVGFTLFMILTTWIKGKALLSKALDEKRVMFEDVEEEIGQLCKVPGTAVYLAKSVHGVPEVLLHNLEHNHVMHERMIVMTIVTKQEPVVDKEHRVKIRTFGEQKQFYRVKLFFGFHEQQDIKKALKLCAEQGLEIDLKNTTFFVGHERIAFRSKSKLASWRRALFKFMFGNASSAIGHFKLPVDRVMEVGIRMEI